jgi:hypothetical protein
MRGESAFPEPFGQEAAESRKIDEIERKLLSREEAQRQAADTRDHVQFFPGRHGFSSECV